MLQKIMEIVDVFVNVLRRRRIVDCVVDVGSPGLSQPQDCSFPKKKTNLAALHTDELAAIKLTAQSSEPLPADQPQRSIRNLHHITEHPGSQPQGRPAHKPTMCQMASAVTTPQRRMMYETPTNTPGQPWNPYNPCKPEDVNLVRTTPDSIHSHQASPDTTFTLLAAPPTRAEKVEAQPRKEVSMCAPKSLTSNLTVHFSPASDRTHERRSFLISLEVLSKMHILRTRSCPTSGTHPPANSAACRSKSEREERH